MSTTINRETIDWMGSYNAASTDDERVNQIKTLTKDTLLHILTKADDKTLKFNVLGYLNLNEAKAIEIWGSFTDEELVNILKLDIKNISNADKLMMGGAWRHFKDTKITTILKDVNSVIYLAKIINMIERIQQDANNKVSGCEDGSKNGECDCK